jgi:hypothetical protein
MWRPSSDLQVWPRSVGCKVDLAENRAPARLAGDEPDSRASVRPRPDGPHRRSVPPAAGPGRGHRHVPVPGRRRGHHVRVERADSLAPVSPSWPVRRLRATRDRGARSRHQDRVRGGSRSLVRGGQRHRLGLAKGVRVGQWGTPGSKRLLQAVTAKANAAVRGQRLPKQAVRDRRRRARELDLAQHLRAYQTRKRAERPWTDELVALLGTMPDTKLAARLGRTRDEVRRERVRRGIPRYRKRPKALLRAATRGKPRAATTKR